MGEESDIQKEIVKALKARGIFFLSIPNERKDMTTLNKMKSLGYTPGAADLLIVRDGRVYFLEVKAPTGRLSDNQKDFRQRALNAGSDYAVVRSVDQAMDCLTVWFLRNGC